MPSIDLPEVQQIGGDENWMNPIVGYLNEGKLPQGRDESRKLKIKSAKYVLMDEVLYKRGFSQPYLRYLAPEWLPHPPTIGVELVRSNTQPMEKASTKRIQREPKTC